MKAKIVIPIIIVLLIVGGIIWYLLKRKKSPEQIERDIINNLIEQQKELNKEVEAANAGKTIEETGGRIGAVRTSNTMTKEEWNAQIQKQIDTYQKIINDYKIKEAELYVGVNHFVKVYPYTYRGMPEYISLIGSINLLNAYIATANESITKLKSQLL